VTAAFSNGRAVAFIYQTISPHGMARGTTWPATWVFSPSVGSVPLLAVWRGRIPRVRYVSNLGQAEVVQKVSTKQEFSVKCRLDATFSRRPPPCL